MPYLPLLAARAQAQLVEWHQGITTIDGSPPPQPLQGHRVASRVSHRFSLLITLSIS